jgi:two-component system sensor histidine kinase DesK
MKQLPYEIKLTFLFALTILLVFALFIILIVVVYKKKQAVFINEKLLQEIEYRNQILEKELEIQKKIQEERERISHDMHDDLGAGISALKLQAEFLKQKVGEQHLKEDIDDLLKTSEEMNLSMREMLWSLNSSNDNLGNFMQYVSLYAESFFKKTNVKINITRKVELPDTKLNAEIRRNFFLCAKEALNNVYKHSKAQNVDILFTLRDHLFTMEIIDDGVGLEESLTSGNGFNNMQRRIQNLCGLFVIKPSEKGLHLVFEIKL